MAGQFPQSAGQTCPGGQAQYPRIKTPPDEPLQRRLGELNMRDAGHVTTVWGPVAASR
jgi:hypothetical protein